MKNLLVFRLSAMGDVAMTVPVIASLLAQYPDVSVTMLTNPRFAAMFTGIDRFSVVGVDTKGEYKGLLGMWHLFRNLRKSGKYDAFVDLHDVIRSKELRFLYQLTGISTCHIDKGRAEKEALAAPEGKKVLKQLKASVQRYADTFAAAGYPVNVNFSSLFSKTAAVELPIPAKLCRWVAVAPFAQHPGKIYPVEKMEEVVRLLAGQPDVQILLFGGGKKEVSVLEGWASSIPNTVSVAGKYPLLTELQIISQCDVLISMDSANMHLASLVGTPVVSVWGATHPFAGFYGYNQDESNAVQVDLPCRPCSIYGNKPCLRSDYACLNNIKPDTIAQQVMKVLSVK